ncbi:MAG: flagellar filament capping protein FliD [Acidobacteriota bacterium]
MAIDGISPYAVGGLASGLDTNGIIDKMIEAKKKQAQYLYDKQSNITRQKEVLRQFNLQLLRFQNAAFDLKMDTYFKAKNVSSSDSNILTATATNSASNGQHTVKVNQLAEAARLISNNFSPRVSNNPPNTAGLTGISGAAIPTPAYIYGAVAEHGVNAGTIATGINSANNKLAVTYDGTTVNITLADATAGTTAMSAVASDMQTKINDALNLSRGTNGVTYMVVNQSATAGVSNDYFRFISNFDGSRHTMSIDSTSTAAAALGVNTPASMTTSPGLDVVGGQYAIAVTAATAFTQGSGQHIDADPAITFVGGETLTISLNGTGPTAVALTTTAAAAYNPNNDTEMSQLAANLQTDINADPSFGTGSVSVTWNNTTERLVFTDGKAGASNTISIADDAVSTMLKLNSGAIQAATAGTDATVVSVFTPDTGSQLTTTITDTTAAGTASNMAVLLKRINGEDISTDVGHTPAGGTGPLMNGVALTAALGLTAGTATINTTRGNELNTQLATYSTYVGDSDIGTTTINCAQTLNSAGFRTAPSTATNGTFTINGKQITISNYTTTTVNDVLAMINGSSAGVTASYDSTNDRFVLTSNSKGAKTITVGSNTDTSDFLNLIRVGYGGTYTQGIEDGTVNPAVSLLSSTMSKTVTSGIFSINGVSIYVDPATDTLNGIIEKINDSAAGVTAKFNASADTLEIISNGDETGHDSITIGSSTDTSNFWWAMSMVYPPLLGGVDDVLKTAITVGSPGQGTKVTVDGTDYLRRSNTIDDIIEGVTLNLKSTSVNPVTLDITSNIDQALAKMKTFIVEYNKTVEMASPAALTKDEREKQLPELTDAQRSNMTSDEIDTYETRREGLLRREVLRKDGIARTFYNTVRQTASAVVPGLETGYNSLSALGINTGMVGNAVGANPHGMLLLESTDEKEIEDALKYNTTFMDALQNAPDKVSTLLGQLTESTTSTTGTKVVSTMNITQQMQFVIGDGSINATIAISAGVYTGANIANLINSKLYTAGIRTIQAIVDSANHLKISATTGESGNNQAIIDITDQSNGMLLDKLGIQSGLYRGVTVQTLTGIGRREETETKKLTMSGGTLNTRIKDGGLLDQQLIMVDEAITSFEKRLTMEQSRLWKQFTTLETYMSNKNAQSTWLTQQIANLGGGGGGSSSK